MNIIRKLNPNPADEIISGLFIGDMYSAANIDFVANNEISVIINCTPTLPNYFKSFGIEYLRIPVDDSLMKEDIAKMKLYLPAVVEYIHVQLKTRRKKILVHCHAGIQRSAIIVAGYILRHVKNINTPTDAINKIIDKRPVAFFNGKSINFEDSLNHFHKKISK